MVVKMNFAELAVSRYSVRSFSDKPVEEEKIQQVLRAGQAAPSARNRQPQQIYLLKSAEALDKIRTITPCAFQAPIVFLMCGDINRGWKNSFTGHDETEMDVSIVTAHMMLQAADIGLGTTWVCYFDSERVKAEFHLPEGIQPFCLLPMGYPAEDAQPNERHFIRRPLSESVQIL